MVEHTYTCGCTVSCIDNLWSWDFCNDHGQTYLLINRVKKLELAITKAISALETNPITGDRTAYTVLKNVLSDENPNRAAYTD